MKRRRLVIWSSVLLLVALLLWQFGGHLLAVYLLGSIEVSARDHVRWLGTVDEVEICSIGGDPRPGDSDTFTGDNGPLAIIGRQTVRGKEAQEIAELWRSLSTGRAYKALCFEPVYGLRFRHNGKVLLKTSVCWKCQTFTLPVALFGQMPDGFDAKSEPAQQLLKVLQTHVPLPSKAEAK
jgi:hypothetical protein